MSKLLPHHARVLTALADANWLDGEIGYLNFKGIMSRSGMATRSEVRRICRHLARRGLTEYGKGLWTDDGEVAGSGYRITKAGIAALEAA